MSKFQMDLVIITAVEQYVSNFAMQQTMQKYPKCLQETELHHEDRELYFEHVYQEIMDNMTATLKSPIWPSMKLPLGADTILQLESKYVK